MRYTAIALCCLLTACGSVPTPPPAPTSGNTKANGELVSRPWVFQYSPNAVGSNHIQGALSFDFPNKDGIHYLVTGVNGMAPGMSSITLDYEVLTTGNPVFEFRTAADNTCPAPLGNVSLYMQRKGDDISGTGAYEYYRFWSRPLLSELKSGTATLTVPLKPDQWITVYGKQYDLSGALPNLQAIGMTFGGGCFAGHGVYVTGGTAKFNMKSYLVK